MTSFPMGGETRQLPESHAELRKFRKKKRAHCFVSQAPLLRKPRGHAVVLCGGFFELA